MSKLTEHQKSILPIVIDEPNTTGRQRVGILAKIMMIVGLVTLGVGAYFILFGSEIVDYHPSSGLTFYQAIQHYASSITAIGFIVTALSRFISNRVNKKIISIRAEAIEQGLKKKGIDWDDFNEHYKLKASWLPEDRISISLTEK